MRYRVTWEIEFDEDDHDVSTPTEAARLAWEMLRHPDSTANVFTVYPETGPPVEVDVQHGTETVQ